jgi:hypothetical protein
MKLQLKFSKAEYNERQINLMTLFIKNNSGTNIPNWVNDHYRFGTHYNKIKYETVVIAESNYKHYNLIMNKLKVS